MLGVLTFEYEQRVQTTYSESVWRHEVNKQWGPNT